MSLFKYLFIFLSCLVAITANAQNIERELANELYVKSGLEKEVSHLPETISAAFIQAAQQDEFLMRLPRSTISRINDQIYNSFSLKRFKNILISEMQSDLNAADIRKVIKWLDSPLGIKCTNLEDAASTAEAFKEIQSYAAKLEKYPPDSNRLKLLQRWDSAIRGTEFLVELAISTQLATEVGILAALHTDQPLDVSKIRKEIEKSRPQIEEMMKAYMNVAMLYTYDSLADSELEEYILFANSKAGKKYHRVVFSGFQKAMVDASLKMGNSIKEVIEATQEQTET